MTEGTIVTQIDKGLKNFDSLDKIRGKSNVIKKVNFSQNEIKEVPSGLSMKMRFLTHLNLSRNRIRTLPPDIDRLANLKYLNCSGNKIKDLPQQFGNLVELTYLDLSENRLEAFFDNFFQLKKLRHLYLSDNGFQIIPDGIKSFSDLKVLALRDNKIKELNVEAFADLGDLRELFLQGNQIEFLPPETPKLLEKSDNKLNVFRIAGNPWILPIAEHLGQDIDGLNELMKYISTSAYKIIYSRRK